MPHDIASDTSASSYLAEVYQRALPKRPRTLVAFLRGNPWTPISDGQKVELIAAATAIVLLYGQDQLFLSELLRTRALTGTSVEASRLVVESLVSGLGDDANSRNRLSAWSAAVRHLLARNISPATIPALAAVKGEGIDKWSRGGISTKLATSKVSEVPAKMGSVTFKVDNRKMTFKVNDHRVLAKLVERARILAALYPVPKKTS